MRSPGATRGPAAWRNAAAFASGQPAGGRAEAMLYGDAHVTGETRGVGPYDVLNPVPFGRDAPHPILVVRATFHEPREPDRELTEADMKTDLSTFHGGGIFDEIAALASLALGIRCRYGGTTRHWFDTGAQDVLGNPTEFDHHAPSLTSPNHSVLPHVREHTDVTMLSSFLGQYFDAPPGDAVAMLRASRQYQQALWIADDDPSQAWLWFVSSLETAAGRWSGALSAPGSVLRSSWPELSRKLEVHGDAFHDEIASVVMQRTGSTRKFIDFAMQFMVDPPDVRPYEFSQVDWSDMRAHLAKVYEFRSQALHSATPFPVPMCEVPRKWDDGNFIERPDGLATTANDGRWNAEDTPMLLWVFEHITRGVLNHWWKSVSG
jgi:hypothetical protein